MAYTYQAEKYKKNKLGPLLKRYFKPALLPAVLAAAVFIPVRYFLIFPVRVQTDAMEKHIKKGSLHFFLQPGVSKIKTGNIVLVKNSRSEQLHLCKVVASEGDRIEMQNGRMKVNEGAPSDIRLGNLFPQELPEEFFPGMQDISIVMPPGEFYCINENRNNIQDSRLWGSFSETNVAGKYVF